MGVAGSRIALVTASASEADAFRAAHPDARIIDCTGRLVMPGLVNTHCHAAMTLQRSYADDIAPDGVASRLYLAVRSAADGR